MARLNSKNSLLKANEEHCKKLLEIITSLSKEELDASFCFDTTKKEAH